MKLVRLKPYAPKKGNFLRRYTAFSVRFDESRGWYRVTDEVAEYLKGVHQISGDEDSVLAFDVCTEAEGKAIDEAEKKKAEERAKAAQPNIADITTVDVSKARPARRV